MNVLRKALIILLIWYIVLFMVFPMFTYGCSFLIFKEVSKMFSLYIQNYYEQGGFGYI